MVNLVDLANLISCESCNYGNSDNSGDSGELIRPSTTMQILHFNYLCIWTSDTLGNVVFNVLGCPIWNFGFLLGVGAQKNYRTGLRVVGIPAPDSLSHPYKWTFCLVLYKVWFCVYSNFHFSRMQFLLKYCLLQSQLNCLVKGIVHNFFIFGQDSYFG